MPLSLHQCPRGIWACHRIQPAVQPGPQLVGLLAHLRREVRSFAQIAAEIVEFHVTRKLDRGRRFSTSHSMLSTKGTKFTKTCLRATISQIFRP